jgi:hypothetical protein
MEMFIETNAVAAAAEAIGDTQAEVSELNQLQLACVAGGCGEVIFG